MFLLDLANAYTAYAILGGVVYLVGRTRKGAPANPGVLAAPLGPQRRRTWYLALAPAAYALLLHLGPLGRVVAWATYAYALYGMWLAGTASGRGLAEYPHHNLPYQH